MEEYLDWLMFSPPRRHSTQRLCRSMFWGELPTKIKRSQQYAIGSNRNEKWTFGAGEVSQRSSRELLIRHLAKSGTAQNA